MNSAASFIVRILIAVLVGLLVYYGIGWIFAEACPELIRRIVSVIAALLVGFAPLPWPGRG